MNLYTYENMADVITTLSKTSTGKKIVIEYMARYGLKEAFTPVIGNGIKGQAHYYTLEDTVAICLLLLEKRGFELNDELKEDVIKTIRGIEE